MRVLTVRQPYASRIVKGTKRVENRSQPTRIRGRVLIHSAKTLAEPESPLFYPWLPTAMLLPRSSVLGTVQIVGSHFAHKCPDVVECLDGGGFAPEDGEVLFHWELAEAREFVTPIPDVKGALGFWRPDDRVAHLSSIADLVEARA